MTMNSLWGRRTGIAAGILAGLTLRPEDARAADPFFSEAMVNQRSRPHTPRHSGQPVAPTAGAHGHHHENLPPASRHARRIMAIILIPAALVTLIAMVVMWPPHLRPAATPSGQRALGDVVTICAQPCGTANVRITDGPGKGTTTVVDLPQGPGAPQLHAGDSVVLLYLPGAVPADRRTP